jgi:hypothetical protein
MKETFVQWLQQAGPFAGALACAVRGPDGAGASRSWAAGFSEASLENALRCVADLFQVIQHSRIAPGRVRWVYGDALLHCERRADGTCFGIFTARQGEAAFDKAGLERMFVEFRAVGLAGPVVA